MEQTFGAGFGAQLLEAPVREWFGPAASAYGLHLVRVLERSEPRLPAFDELRDRLSTDYSFETRQTANAEALKRLTERYQIVFVGSWSPPAAELVNLATSLREGAQR